METVTISTILSSVGDIFSTAIGWVGDVASTVTGQPLLLMFVVIPACGLGVGLFKRLLNVQ